MQEGNSEWWTWGEKADFASVRPGEKRCASGLQDLGSTMGNTCKQSWASQMAWGGPNAESGCTQRGDVQSQEKQTSTELTSLCY